MASFTSTSPFSGSVWDGPTGSPIVSPSNWQTQVLDNLTVFENHNHSGSAGEGIAVIAGSFFPTIDNDYFSAMFPVASTGWNLRVASAVHLFGGACATTYGASIAYDVYLRSGVYTIQGGFYLGGVTTGCIDVYIDDIIKGQMPPNIGFSVLTLTSVSVVGAGERRLKFVNVPQNGSASDPLINYISVRRTSS